MTKEDILDAVLSHVVFDGWSQAAFEAGLRDLGISLAEGKAIYPRGAMGVAIAFHERGDRAMIARMKSENLLGMKYSARVAAGVRYRLEAAETHKEEVRRGTSLFALPQNAPEGAKLVWGTADAIWNTLGDRSEDHNWYTKRATLSGVYSATVLFWLGDTSEGHSATWEFLDRRIENVMQIEKLKAQINDHPLASKLMAGPNWLLSRVRKPVTMPDPDLPGHFSGRKAD